MEQDFYEILYNMNKLDILNKMPFTSLTFHNTKLVNEYLLDIVNNDRKVFIYGDYDPDGLFSALIAYEALKKFGCTNLKIYNYKRRTHKLDDLAVIECIQSLPDYVIICDTASSEISKLERIRSYGIKIIVLDHHSTIYEYDDFKDIVIINTVIENSLLKEKAVNVSDFNKGLENYEDVYKLSAGALTFCVMENFSNLIGIDIKILSTFALISLYSDCMDMYNRINRSIYFLAQSFDREALPSKIQMFMHPNSNFYSRFIQFKMVPQINSVFRTEKFEYINKCFFDTTANAAEISRSLAAINTIYVSSRDMVAAVSDTIDYDVCNNFIFADLKSVNDYFKVYENKLYNYTGLIANKLSDRYGKPAVVICGMKNYFKGSFRDTKGRHYLQIFRQFCEAGGHNSAFGLQIPFLEYNSFQSTFKRLDEQFTIQDVNNSPIILDYQYLNPDSKLIREIALYNEFAGQSIPFIYLRKLFTANMSGGKTKFYYLYRWGDCTIQSDFALDVGTKILIQPIRNQKNRVVTITS